MRDNEVGTGLNQSPGSTPSSVPDTVSREGPNASTRGPQQNGVFHFLFFSHMTSEYFFWGAGF